MASTDELLYRLSTVDDRLQSLKDEVDSIRRLLAAEAPEAAPPAPSPQPAPPSSASPSPPPPRRDPFPSAPRRPAAPPPKPPRAPGREIDFAALFGPKAFAWAGGVVTLLGVVFFFVLAVNRGWIGPGARVGFGAAASALVFAGGVWLRRRYDETDAALAAVGAGIAGAYATLAAATALYDLVSKPFALVAATGIAAAGLAVSLAWRAELVAALGLVGAICAPALLAFEGGLTATGTGFAAIVTAAAAAVAVRMGWQRLLAAAAIASAPQVVALVVDAPKLDVPPIALACVFVVLYVGAAVAVQLRSGDARLQSLPTLLILAGMALTWLTANQLFEPSSSANAGFALLVAAGALGATTVAVWLRGQRELGTLLGTVALAVTAVGTADILSGATLAYVFAAETAVLVVAARRVREPRLQLGALAYLVLAGGHALVFDSPPDALFETARHPASGAPALVAVAVAAFIAARGTHDAWNDSSERGVLAFLAPVVATVRSHQRELRLGATALAVLFAGSALSLAVLELFEAAWQTGGVAAAFDRGHVAVTGLWSAAGVAAALASRHSQRARLVVLLWLGATALKVVGYDAVHLDGWAFTLAFVLLASALLLVGYLWERLAERAQPTEESIVVVVGAVAFAVASLQPWDTDRARGVGLLCIAAVLTAFAAPVFARLRNLATLLWAPALALAAVAAWLLLDDTLLVLAWTAGAAALTGLAVATKERRLHAASLGYLLLGVAAALVDAPPSQLVSARAHPAHGIVSLLLAIVAVLAFAWGERDPEEDEWRTASLWTAATLAVYTASLGILELAVRVSSAGLHTDFQRGHTAVSALWGALGLTLLYVGLRQRRPALRFGGLALFVISLGKLFLYDLSQLSSITRALSFLAVGAVLLLAGFFTQKLSADGAETRGPAVE